MKRVQIYGKPQCKLCLEVYEIMKVFESQGACSVQYIDITQRPFLHEQFRYDVPLVWVDDVIRARHRVDAAEMEAILKEGA